MIELLVVILIIGILAAVAIPAFLNQKGKASDANVKSDVTSAQTALETYYTDNQTYVGATPAALIAIEPTLTNAALTTAGKEALTLGSLTSSGYAITASDPNSITFTVTKVAGVLTRTCSVPANANPAGCKGAAQVTTGTSPGTW